jgi:hypothetical protein
LATHVAEEDLSHDRVEGHDDEVYEHDSEDAPLPESRRHRYHRRLERLQLEVRTHRREEETKRRMSKERRGRRGRGGGEIKNEGSGIIHGETGTGIIRLR